VGRIGGMMIVIEKDIAIPNLRRKYPWKDMQVGDSFFIEGIVITKITATAYQTGLRLGRKFLSRTVENGVRVWRIE
jgi:hypothetical protein